MDILDSFQADVISWLGSDEQTIITEARLLIKAGVPVTSQETDAYLSKNIRIRGELVNLKSRVHFVSCLQTNKLNSHVAGLLGVEEYARLPKGDRDIYFTEDNQYVDLKMLTQRVEVVQKYLEELTWLLKSAADFAKRG